MPADQPQDEMSFLEHLEALRWHIVRSVVAIIVLSVAAFAAKEFVFGTLILGPSRPDFWFYQMACKFGQQVAGSTAFCIEQLPFIIQSRKMTGQFSMHITVSLVLGFVVAFPYVFWEIWRFISPALYDTEKRNSRGATFFVSLLFSLGVLFGYFIVSPISINFLANYQVDPSVLNEFDITSYVSTITMLVLACGLMFQLPMVVFFMSKAGIVTPSVLRNYRRHAIVVILILGAIITPPDPISQVLIALPILILYEISISVSGAVLKRKLKKQKLNP
ncbi:twin-arginine translocase subunit TatC [Marivirga atlantica]|jgi:sec-independent protein translocase protein TatC|uniref:Sec-independent protein translocase protein TatC n=1 Tax=Marivirga atlantica TaxID=1548457 RepID=A0A937DDZ2_9BACT|nr:twin-arginine translocase subunit TatC [Marivirga atlantica]MBL0764717.1 twin-arginine translocase subunit TatC [Marivirga atlantica]